MVAGRLEIRVVSSPLPERDSRLSTEIKVVPDKIHSGKSGLELLEETIAKKVCVDVLSNIHSIARQQFGLIFSGNTKPICSFT